MGAIRVSAATADHALPGLGPVLAQLTDGAAVTGRLAADLAALATAAIRPTRVDGPREQLARSHRAAGRAAAAVPELRQPLTALLADLEHAHAELTPRRLVPVHGAPHMHHWLVEDTGRNDQHNDDGGGRLGLIDFDRFALGEPELDLATFLADLDSESARQVPMPALEAAAVAGFEDNGVPLTQPGWRCTALTSGWPNLPGPPARCVPTAAIGPCGTCPASWPPSRAPSNCRLLRVDLGHAPVLPGHIPRSPVCGRFADELHRASDILCGC